MKEPEEIVKKVENYIRQYHMIEAGDRIAAGISGGADSVCLFYMLLKLQRKYGFNFLAVHVNHGLRGEDARKDELFVRRLSEEHGVFCEIVQADMPGYARAHNLSPEEAGRELRYQAFESIAALRDCQRIAVAHTKNDNAETVLFQMARGSGVTGMAGIRPVRDRVVRPLLCLTRGEVETYLDSIHAPYCEDVTNASDAYARNRVRRHILPAMQELVNERAVEHICESAERFAEAEDYLEKQTNLLWGRVVNAENGKYFVNVAALLEEHEFMQGLLLHSVLREAAESAKDLESKHVHILRGLLIAGSGKKADLPYGLEAVREYKSLILQKKERTTDRKTKTEIQEQALSIPGETRLWQGRGRLILTAFHFEGDFSKIPENDYTKWMDYDKIGQSLTLRCRRPGDYLIVTKEGGRKKLKDYFMDQKIPRDKREQIPLIAQGSRILWVVGERMSEDCKIDETTKTVLMITVSGGNGDG